MTIDALTNLTDQQASQVLAQAVLATLPHPTEVDQPSELDAIVLAVLAELRSRLKLSATELSAKSRADLQAELAKEMSSRILSDSSRAAAINRASAAGRLGTGSYRVKFTDTFDSGFRTLGVRRSTVEKAIRDPDFEHHLTGDIQNPDDVVLSFFLKRMPAKGVLPNHYLLVQAGRHGVDLTVDAAWWIYKDVEDSSKAGDPIEYLREFATQYGVAIALGGRIGKFLFQMPFSKPAGAEPDDDSVFLEEKGADGVGFSFVMWNRLTDVATIQLAYCINTEKYRSDLRKRGAI